MDTTLFPTVSTQVTVDREAARVGKVHSIDRAVLGEYSLYLGEYSLYLGEYSLYLGEYSLYHGRLI